MSFRFKRIAVVAAFALVAGGFVSQVKAADDGQWPSVFTLREPLQINDRVLSPGTYLFQLSSGSSFRNVVQIYNFDKKRWDGFFMGVPAYRSGNSERGRFELAASTGDHQVLQYWFYPGMTRGIEFVYRKSAF